MSKQIDRREVDKKDFVVVKDGRTLDVTKVIAPHELQVGIEGYKLAILRVEGDEFITGRLTIDGGCKGALKLFDGTPAVKSGTGTTVVAGSDGSVTVGVNLQAGVGIDLTTNDDGQVTIAASGGGGGVSAHTALTALAWTSSGHTGTASRLAGFDGGGAAAYTQIGASGGVQAYDATLASLSLLGTAADRIAYTTGIDTWAETALTSFGRSLIDDADAATARTTLGLTIGTNVQAWDADLDGYAALASPGLVTRTGAGTAAARTLTAGSGQVTVTDGDCVAGNPTVDLAYAGALRETGGPTTLTVGAVADGQYLRRSGSSIVGAYLALVVGVTGGDLTFTDGTAGVELTSAAVTAGTVA